MKGGLEAHRKPGSLVVVLVVHIMDLCFYFGFVICCYYIYCLYVNITPTTNVYTETCTRAVAVCATIFGGVCDINVAALSESKKVCGWVKDKKGHMRQLVGEKIKKRTSNKVCLGYDRKNIKSITESGYKRNSDGYRKVKDRTDAGDTKFDGYRKGGDRKDFFHDMHKFL